MEDEIEARTITQLAWRFVPFLVVCYFVAYLDRVNVGFAKLTMDADIELTDTMFGFGAGVFFLAYFLLEVPSNMALDRVGADWIARIMFSWGSSPARWPSFLDIAPATGLSGEHTFYCLRVLLGFAEAGFFPGIIFFLTLSFPAPIAPASSAISWRRPALSSALGSPVSASLVGLDGAVGFKGWQWLFIAEAPPSLVLAAVTYFYLTDRPADARWLAEERASGCAAARSRRRAARQCPRPARSRAFMTARARAVAHLFRRRRPALRRQFLASDDRQGSAFRSP